MTENTIYEDIARRTGGDIYIGVVGPVRTGKSTFISRFMETAVIPRIEDEARRRGLIKEDETGVVVEGLPDDELARLLEDIELEDTRPWYIKALDVVFFYSRDSWQ